LQEGTVGIIESLKNALEMERIDQIGIVVRNIDETSRQLHRLLGIDFTKVFVPEYFNKTYRGKPSDFRIKVALAKLGPMEVELIEVLEGETIHGEFLDTHGEGIHHFGVQVEDFDKALGSFRDVGIDVLMGGEREGARFAYLDTQESLGFILELIHREQSPFD
jgi:hypothetical protein